jgi:ABC-2 type transport system permease protein
MIPADRKSGDTAITPANRADERAGVTTAYKTDGRAVVTTEDRAGGRASAAPADNAGGYATDIPAAKADRHTTLTPAAKAVKYAAIGRVTVKNHVAYIMDFLLRTVFFIIIIYIFIQLWTATYHGEGSTRIAGFTLGQIIWYLIFTEAMTLAKPSLSYRIEEEVKSGDVGYRLVRPVNYIGFHYVSYIGEVYFRLLINLAVGVLLGVLVLGLPSFGWGWAGFLALTLGGFTVNFLLNMMLALCAFWVEETRGLEFVYNKLLFTVGGMLMPLEVFPDRLQRVCVWLPFQTVLYFPAKAAVAFQAGDLPRMLGIQCFWIALLTVGVAAIYRKGVKKLNVNGG